MSNRFNPTALKLMEDALAEVFYSHHDFDAFIRRCGVETALLSRARMASESRKGSYERAPKRFVAQEVLKLLEAKGDTGLHTLTSIFDALVKGTFQDASPKGKQTLLLLKEQFEQDREQRLQEEKSRREWQAQRERESSARVVKVERHPQDIARIQQKFLEMHSASDPHKRGRDFEVLIVELLEAEALSPRHGISRVGEQIDISFEFGSQTYLVEARWKKDQSEPKELRDFHGKCQGVHVDVRGVFISVQGYTSGCAEALTKLGELRVVMLDGTHLMSVFSGAITFGDLLKKAVRKACDERDPYVPLSSLIKSAV
jgi:hypothetical protein